MTITHDQVENPNPFRGWKTETGAIPTEVFEIEPGLYIVDLSNGNSSLNKRDGSIYNSASAENCLLVKYTLYPPGHPKHPDTPKVNPDANQNLDQVEFDYFQEQPDLVNKPKHYVIKEGFEVLDVVDFAIRPLGGIEGHYLGSVIAYLARAAHKGTFLQDLKKARFYLDRLIQLEESK